MKNKEWFSKIFSSGKVLYISTAVAVFAIVASVLVSHYTSRKLEQLIPNTGIAGYTSPAEVNKTDVPDDRDETEADITEAESTERQTQTQTTALSQQAQETEYTPVNNSFCLPVDSAVTKKYSESEPVFSKTMNDWRTHTGLDFEAEENADIHSIGNGKVTKVIADQMWGYVIEIDYGSFTARYCGIKQGTSVSIDDEVKMGDVIGKLGTIPIESEDTPHLHFEAVKDGKTVDPMLVLGE